MNDSTDPQSLPVLPQFPVRASRRWSGWLVHVCRVGVVFGILWTIHLSAERARRQQVDTELEIEQVAEWYPAATHWGPTDPKTGAMQVLGSQDKLLGYVVETSPQMDEILGFSGPTNVLIGLNAENVVVGIKVLWSRDTKEHLQAVVQNKQFMQTFDGLSWDQIAHREQPESLDGVSGATLTSLAMAQSVVQRLGGDAPSLKFPEEPSLEDVFPLFEKADHLSQDKLHPEQWHVFDADDVKLGSIIRTSPAADNIVGYQGPTECLISLNSEGVVQKIRVRKSYENEPYYGYLNEDWSFRYLFQNLTMEEVATFDLVANEVEGVSGATMTSMAVAKGVVETAKQYVATTKQPEATPTPAWSLTSAQIGSLIIFGLGILIALTNLRGISWLRACYQLVLIGYVGFVNGDMLSLAMLGGWAEHGIPWKSAVHFVALMGAAIALPIGIRRNIYCSHLCPHGAVQQLVRSRLPWTWHLGKWSRRLLRIIPVGLLGWAVVVSALQWPYSLVDIEPFDAYSIRIAGWATITVAIIGVVFSLFVPMGYCRFGCPTGSILNYLRRNAQSHKLSLADGVAISFLVIAVLCS